MGTVTELVTGASMTVTGAAMLDWCAGVTTANSSELTTMRRTTAVRDQLLEDLGEDIQAIHHQAGVPGVPGDVWLLELLRGYRSAQNGSALSTTAGLAPGTLSRDTPTLNVFKLLHTISHNITYHNNNFPNKYFVQNLVDKFRCHVIVCKS